MSRQFNEYMEHRFELFGEEYELIDPTNLEELVAALHIKDLLQQGINSHEPDSGHPYYHLHRTQEEWIDEYVVRLGELDNSIMMRNIAYLTKKNGIGIGDLEKVLGISTGYISRTAKGNSGKKMSIDNVWRIARLFGVELRALLETDLQIPNQNTELLVRFLEKLRQQTEDNKIQWHNCGGACSEMEERLAVLPYFTEDTNSEEIIYRASHLNPKARFVLADDIYSCKDITPGKEFLMIGYALEGKEESYHIDFYFLSIESPSSNKYRLDKAFFTLDDRFGTLDTFAGNLMDRVQQQEMDAAITPDVRSLITNYLK